jgi:hypothetical protein
MGTYAIEDPVQVGGVGQISIVEMKASFFAKLFVVVEVIDPIRIERTAPANHAMNFIALFEKLLGQIGAVLSRDTGDECLLHGEVKIIAVSA